MNRISQYCLAFILSISSIYAQSNVQMPQLLITHEGRLTKNMPDYVWGSMALIDGQDTIVLDARFKTRGATAMQYLSKPALSMKLRSRQPDGTELEIDSTLLGLRSASSWILDAMAIDRIQMRNRVAFDIWNEFSHLPYETEFGARNGTVGRFVEVTINGQYKGIYCLTDRINRKLLDLKKPELDVNGNLIQVRGALYKHGTNDIGDQNIGGVYNDDHSAYVVAWHDAWELSEPDDYPCLGAWDALNTLYLYNNAKDADWVRAHFTLSQLAEYQIFITALAIADNWGTKNSFLSIRNMRGDGEKNKYVYTPWDLDTSLGGRYDGAYYNGTYTDWKVADVMKQSGPIPFSILAAQPDYLTELRNAWIRGSKGALSVASVQAKLETYRDLFLQSGAWDRHTANPNGARLCSVSSSGDVCSLTDEVAYVVAWYSERFAEMDAYFNVSDTDRANYVALESAQIGNQSSKLVVRNGQVLISQGNMLFTLTGQKAE